MASPNLEFDFKVRTVKWFGLLSAVVILLMIGLGFWYLDKIIESSTAFESRLNFQQALTKNRPDEAVVRLGIEYDGLAMRNKRTVSALYMRAYSQFLAIITGSVLALLGAVFVLARVDNVKTEGEAAVGSFRIMLQSASPGIIVAAVGTALVGWVVFIAGTPITATDSPIFHDFAGAVPASEEQRGPGSTFDLEMKAVLERIKSGSEIDR